MAKRRKPSRAEREPATEEVEETEAPSRPAPRRGKPWWLIVVVGLVLGGVVWVELSDSGGDERLETVGDPVAPDAPPPAIERLEVRVIHSYPHATDAFTQGLLWYDGSLYESTGLRYRSTLREVDLETGEVRRRRSLEDRYFAEGLARVGDALYQLTWEAGTVHVWAIEDFAHRRTFDYDGEGWGLCYDGTHLVMSDGSERLTFRDPETFHVDHVVRVRDDDGWVEELNELECVDGAVWANVWQSDRIVRVDPESGRVTGDVDASGLLSLTERIEADVLNGIAWIPERGHFVITGKEWPWLFEVDFVPEGEGDRGAE